jgi:hypothetical protein
MDSPQNYVQKINILLQTIEKWIKNMSVCLKFKIFL